MARELSRDARLLYKALWSEADDEGRLRGNEAYLHGTLFPYDPGSWFADALQQLIQTGRAVLYAADGGSYIYLPKLAKHQKFDHPTPSKLPPPPEASREPRDTLASASRDTRAVAGSGERVAGSGERVGGAGGGALEATPPGPPSKHEPTRKSDRAKHVGPDTEADGLDTIDLCRKAYAKLWQSKHGGNGASYPDQPGQDRKHVHAVIDHHRRNKIAYPWKDWVACVFAHYLAIHDDKLVVSSNHALRFLPGAMPRIVEAVAAELSARPADEGVGA